jgi:hypothetical protein
VGVRILSAQNQANPSHRDVPESDRPVLAGGRQRPAVGGEFGVVHVSDVPTQRRDPDMSQPPEVTQREIARAFFTERRKVAGEQSGSLGRAILLQEISGVSKAPGIRVAARDLARLPAESAPPVEPVV